MLEMVFSDSAAGALSVAQGGGRYIGGASSVLVPGEGEPSQEDRERLLRRFEERERRGWEQAAPAQDARLCGARRRPCLPRPKAPRAAVFSAAGAGRFFSPAAAYTAPPVRRPSMFAFPPGGAG